MNSNYLKLKVIDRLSATQGFDNGIVHNENFKELSSYVYIRSNELQDQGPNTNYYASDNFVPFDGKYP